MDDLSDYELADLNRRLKALNEPGCLGALGSAVLIIPLVLALFLTVVMTIAFYKPVFNMHCAWVPMSDNNAYVYTCYPNVNDIPPGAHS